MPLNDTAINVALDALDESATQITHIGVHTLTDPGTGTNANAGEATGGSPAYARVAVTWGAAASRLKSNTGALTIDVPAGTYGFFTMWNAMVTTAAPAGVTTGTAIKTLLQLATPSTTDIRICAWGIEFDGAPNAIKTELVQTDVAATVTAHVISGLMPFNDSNAPASKLTLGTAATGFTASAEGTTTASRLFDFKFGSYNSYTREWPLGHEPRVPVSKFLRVRVTAAAAVNAIGWVMWKEG